MSVSPETTPVNSLVSSRELELDIPLYERWYLRREMQDTASSLLEFSDRGIELGGIVADQKDVLIQKVPVRDEKGDYRTRGAKNFMHFASSQNSLERANATITFDNGENGFTQLELVSPAGSIWRGISMTKGRRKEFLVDGLNEFTDRVEDRLPNPGFLSQLVDTPHASTIEVLGALTSYLRSLEGTAGAAEKTTVMSKFATSRVVPRQPNDLVRTELTVHELVQRRKQATGRVVLSTVAPYHVDTDNSVIPGLINKSAADPYTINIDIDNLGVPSIINKQYRYTTQTAPKRPAGVGTVTMTSSDGLTAGQLEAFAEAETHTSDKDPLQTLHRHLQDVRRHYDLPGTSSRAA